MSRSSFGVLALLFAGCAGEAEPLRIVSPSDRASLTRGEEVPIELELETAVSGRFWLHFHNRDLQTEEPAESWQDIAFVDSPVKNVETTLTVPESLAPGAAYTLVVGADELPDWESGDVYVSVE